MRRYSGAEAAYGTPVVPERTRRSDLPVPVAPVMITFACVLIHALVPSWRSRARSSSRFGV